MITQSGQNIQIGQLFVPSYFLKTNCAHFGHLIERRGVFLFYSESCLCDVGDKDHGCYSSYRPILLPTDLYQIRIK